MWTVDLWSSLLGPWGHPLRHLFPLGKPRNLSYPQFSALLASLDFFFQIFTCFSLIFSSHMRSKTLKLNENTQVFLSDPPNPSNPSNPRNLPPNPQSSLASKWGRRNARSVSINPPPTCKVEQGVMKLELAIIAKTAYFCRLWL